MKKLRMDVETIEVSRFETTPERPDDGTVVAHGDHQGTNVTICFESCWRDSCITGPPSPCGECP